MTDPHTIPAILHIMLPDGTDPALCVTTTFGSLRTAFDLDYDGFYWRKDIETAAPPVMILPGWYADDGNTRVCSLQYLSNHRHLGARSCDRRTGTHRHALRGRG